MKGVGRVDGWRVKDKSCGSIEWEQTHGKRGVAVWRVGFGDDKVGYEMTTMPDLKTRTFRGAGSHSRVIAAAKRYMQAHP